jgi:uncharacterized protein (DUF488 family)
VAAGLELFTIGHGAVGLDEFLEYLRAARIASLVDVRRFPGSRRHPQFGSASLASALRENGIDYRHVEDLGGRRRPHADSPNVGLRNEGFRGYADWMLGRPFVAAFSDLLEEARQRRCAVMCAETPWWKCHRRLIADAAILLAGGAVRHVMGAKEVPHRLTAGVLAEQGHLLYV